MAFANGKKTGISGIGGRLDEGVKRAGGIKSNFITATKPTGRGKRLDQSLQGDTTRKERFAKRGAAMSSFRKALGG